MPRPPRHNLRIVAASTPGDWAADTDATLLKSHGGGSVWRTTLAGRECVVKCLRVGSVRQRLGCLLHATPAWRHWRNARWLREHGFSTGEPLAVLHAEETDGGGAFECLVLQYLPGRSVLDLLASGDLGPRERRHLAGAVGRLAARMSREGRFNRDAKPSNLIVTSLHETGAHLAVIDCADLRPCRVGDHAVVARMLASAMLEPMGCGVVIPLTMRARCIAAAAEALDPRDARAIARSLWRRTREIVASHGDPTPRENPLGASSR
ncbi:MAG: hypothetical protein IPJ41_18430 [Phycisphaerales bacterium]|nr:hypothetical protein [Phycisphaerales bacterium]